MNFDDIQYKIVRGVISQQTVKLMQWQFELMTRSVYHHHKAKETDYIWGDEETPYAFGRYGHCITEGLLELLRPTMEQHTEKRLFPTYSFIRRYFNKSTLREHMDRPSCQYSATLTLEADRDPWAIWVRDREGNPVEAKLHPGDMMIYRGDIRPHWREEYHGKKHTQIFLHYVDADGPFAGYKYDTRDMLSIGGFDERTINRRAKGIL